MSNVWQSTLTKDMVSHLDDETIAEIVEMLDDAVANICEEYDIE